MKRVSVEEEYETSRGRMTIRWGEGMKWNPTAPCGAYGKRYWRGYLPIADRDGVIRDGCIYHSADTKRDLLAKMRAHL